MQRLVSSIAAAGEQTLDEYLLVSRSQQSGAKSEFGSVTIIFQTCSPKVTKQILC